MIGNVGTAVVMFPIVKGFRPSPILDDARFTVIPLNPSLPL
jgi:hypothetical protein